MGDPGLSGQSSLFDGNAGTLYAMVRRWRRSRIARHVASTGAGDVQESRHESSRQCRSRSTVASNGRSGCRRIVKHGADFNRSAPGCEIAPVHNRFKVIVSCRAGLLIPADSHGGFQQMFGTSDYEGCHMNMLGFLKSGSTLAVTWDDAYVWPEVQSSMIRESDGKSTQRITAGSSLRRSARTIRLTPLGKGEGNLAPGTKRIERRNGWPPSVRSGSLRCSNAPFRDGRGTRR